jgi:hypothetical protein
MRIKNFYVSVILFLTRSKAKLISYIYSSLGDGPKWTWIILNLLPIESDLQYTALTSQSFRTRLQMINNTIDFLLNQQQLPTASTTDE